jgi:cytochrome c biogenesis protein CcmG/thiol:disulfide interchange protein DsbE
MGSSEKVLILAVTAMGLIQSANAQESGRDAAWVARAVEATLAHSEQYTFEAAIELARKNGDEPAEPVANFKVKVAVAPQGKYLLSVGDQNKLEYKVVSDGQHTWAYMPASNKYMKVEARHVASNADPDEAFSVGVEEQDRDAFLCSNLILPIMARVGTSAALVEMTKVADVEVEGEQKQLPVLSVLTEKDDRGRQSLTEIVVDPETMSLPRLEWTKSVTAGEELRFAVLKAEIESLRIGDPIPPSYFVFNPPSGAQLVSELPIPGLDGSFLFNDPAPAFELKAMDGSKVRLSALRGRFVLLAFLSNDCTGCPQQLAALANIQEAYKGLVVLAIANGVTALTGATPRPNAVLDDAGAKVQRLYRVQLVPTIVLINGQGTVVRFLAGARDLEALRDELRSAGLEPAATE